MEEACPLAPLGTLKLQEHAKFAMKMTWPYLDEVEEASGAFQYFVEDCYKTKVDMNLFVGLRIAPR